MRATLMLTIVLGGFVGCGGLELGGVSEDSSEVEILTEEEAAEVAEEEIDESNLESELDELMDEIEEDEEGL